MLQKLQDILRDAVQDEMVSDVFLVAGLPVTVKSDGEQVRMPGKPLMPGDIRELVDEAYDLSMRSRQKMESGCDDDFSLSLSREGDRPGGRFRVNVFRQRGSLAMVVRVIRFELPDPVKLRIPEEVLSLADMAGGGRRGGLVLVAGAAGTGKTTTLACLVDRINQTRGCHIITMEDPIEYVHRHNKAIVTQREISIDTPGYAEALRSAMREGPDVILVGEMRDAETMSAALTAAETGVLVLSTLHTASAPDTIDRIVDAFQAKDQVRIQLSQVLRAVVCQQLVMPSTDSGDGDGDGMRAPAFEILKCTEAVRNMIRENKSSQLVSAMQAGRMAGMRTMDGSLAELYRDGAISREDALRYRLHYSREYMEKLLDGAYDGVKQA